MASITQHIVGCLNYNEKYLKLTGEDLTAFLVGGIAPDAAKAGGDKGLEAKNIAHFLTISKARDIKGPISFAGEVPDINIFVERYKEELKNDNPAVLGMFIHLVIDSEWFDYFLKELVLENIQRIKAGATLLEDITFGEGYAWYRENVFRLFDQHDIIFFNKVAKYLNQISKYDVAKFPLSEIDPEDLQSLLKKIKDKSQSAIEIINPVNLLISEEQMLGFLSMCSAKAKQILLDIKLSSDFKK